MLLAIFLVFYKIPVKATSEYYLYVDGFDYTETDWNTVGDSPWLHTCDGSGVIYDKTQDHYMAIFSFESIDCTDISGVWLQARIKGGPTNPDADLYLYNGTSWKYETTLLAQSSEWVWHTYDIYSGPLGSQIDTEAKINNLWFALKIDENNADDIYIDCIRLKVLASPGDCRLILERRENFGVSNYWVCGSVKWGLLPYQFIPHGYDLTVGENISISWLATQEPLREPPTIYFMTNWQYEGLIGPPLPTRGYLLRYSSWQENFSYDVGTSDKYWVAIVNPNWINYFYIHIEYYEAVKLLNHPPSSPVVEITPSSPYTTDDLTCTVATPSSDLDGDTVTYTYEWYKDGDLQQTTVTTDLTDTLSSALTSRGETWKCVVTPNDGKDDGPSDEDQVTIQNTPPTQPTVDVTPNSPVTTDDLTCTVTTPSSDPDGDTITYTYEWCKDGILQAGETTVTTALSDTVLSSKTKRNEVWKCVVTPNDGTVDGPPDDDSVTILNSPPVASNVEITPSAPNTTENLVGSYDYSDADADGESGTQIRWYNDNILQSAYNDQLTIPSSATSENEEWYFTVKPKDGTDFGGIIESNKVTIQEAPPEQYELTVTSSPITGITFTIDEASQTTPYTEWLLEGSYTLEMPEIHDGYEWSHWLEDGDTDRIKTIYLQGTTWTGVYKPKVPVGGVWVPINKLELLAPWIGLASLITVAAISIVFVKRRKKKQS